MKKQMNKIVMLLTILFVSTQSTGCFLALRMQERPSGQEEEVQTEQAETEMGEEMEGVERAEEREDARGQEDTKEQGPKEQQEPEPQSTPAEAPGSGNGSGKAVSPAQEAKIRHIQEIYDRTIQDEGYYRQEGGRYYTAGGVLAKATVSNGDPVLDEAMRKNGYQTYSLEYFYEDWPDGDPYPIYIYAVINDKVYRYYFCQGEFIRRIGPEGGGNTNDAPTMNAFIQTLRDEGASYRRQAQAALTSSPGTSSPQVWTIPQSGTGYAASSSASEWTRAEKIAYVQAVHSDIEYSLPYLSKDSAGWYRDGYGRLKKAVVSNGNATIDNAMRKNGYSAYVLEYYFDDANGSMIYNDYPALIHAVIDGKEYIYYFFDGEFIRRVGPEGGGNTNDAPQINSFIETLRDEGARLYEG